MLRSEIFVSPCGIEIDTLLPQGGNLDNRGSLNPNHENRQWHPCLTRNLRLFGSQDITVNCSKVFSFLDGVKFKSQVFPNSRDFSSTRILTGLLCSKQQTLLRAAASHQNWWTETVSKRRRGCLKNGHVQSFSLDHATLMMINWRIAVTNHVKRMDTSTKETFTFVVIYKTYSWSYSKPISR